VRYVKLHRNVYAPASLELTPFDRAVAAWLWAQGDAVLVGGSAAAVLGTRWLPSGEPAELARSRQQGTTGIVIRTGLIAEDEQQVSRGMTCTTPARTAYDLGRRLVGETAVIRVDALMNATTVSVEQIRCIAGRYPGARGLRQLRNDACLCRRRRGVSTGDAAATAARRVRSAATGDPDPGEERLRQSNPTNRYGLSRIEGRCRVRRRATFHQSRRLRQ
jgi:hypothetical protein